jgi:hypothetical protein
MYNDDKRRLNAGGYVMVKEDDFKQNTTTGEYIRRSTWKKG